MTTILLPFHQDDRLGERDIVLTGAKPAVVAPDLTAPDRWQRLTALYDALAREVSRSVQTGGPTTVVTGDCLALLGTLAGVQRSGIDPSVIWFDAHGDVHTVASSTSGYLGGMALRMAMGGDPDLLAGPLGLRPLAESQAVLVDGRDLDPAEVEYLAASEVVRRRVADIGPEDLPAPAILHVDLDVIDAAEIPGLRFPVPDGPSAGEVVAALDRILAGGRVVALDIACPWHEPADEAQGETRRDLLARVTGLVGG